MKYKIFSLFTMVFLLVTFFGCNEIEKKINITVDEIESKTTRQLDETITVDETEEETTTQVEEPIALGFEVMSSDFNVDWNSSINPFMLFEVTPDYYLSNYYDNNVQNYVLNTHEKSGNLLDTLNYNYVRIVKHYGEQGLLYIVRDSDVYKTIKVNKNGVVWEKEGTFSQSDVHFPTQDGGYITTLKKFDFETHNWKNLLIKLNKIGDLVWEFGPYDDVNMLREYEDGSFIFKYSNREFGNYKTHIVKYNSLLEQVMDIEVLGLLNSTEFLLTEDYIYVYVNINNKEQIQCFDLYGNYISEYIYPRSSESKYKFSLLTYEGNDLYFLEHEVVMEPSPHKISAVSKLDVFGYKDVLSPYYDEVKILKKYNDGSVILSYENPHLNYLKIASDGSVIYDKKMVNCNDNLNFHIYNFELKDLGFMYHYKLSNGDIIGRVDAYGNKQWQTETYSESYSYIEGINDDIYVFYDGYESDGQLAHYNSQGELINIVTITGTIETFQNFKVLENGYIVYNLTDFQKQYLIILSPTGETLYNQELKGFIYDNFGDHKTFFTINDNGEREKVILNKKAIGFISFQEHYYY